MVRNTLNVPRSLFVGFEPLLDELERIHSADIKNIGVIIQQEYLDITRPSNFVSYGGLR